MKQQPCVQLSHLRNDYYPPFGASYGEDERRLLIGRESDVIVLVLMTLPARREQHS
jgi:hypothetical protein